MKTKTILTGVILLAIAIGTKHILLLLGMLIGVILIYFYVRRYCSPKKDIPRTWKTTSRDIKYVFGEVGRENTGFSREIYADNKEK